MVLANITDYSVALFIHILAVVLTFGPTFGYGFLFSVLPKYPRAAPGLIRVRSAEDIDVRANHGRADDPGQ